MLKPFWISFVLFFNYIHQDYPYMYISIYLLWRWSCVQTLTRLLNFVFYLICGVLSPYLFLFFRCAKQMDWQNNLQWRCRRKGNWKSRIVPAHPRKGTTTGVPGATNWTFSCQWLAIRWAFLTSGGFLTCALEMVEVIRVFL